MAVTTAVDSDQYAWLAHLAGSYDGFVNNSHFLCCSVAENLPQIYFRINPLASNTPGSVWGEFYPSLSQNVSTADDVLISWDHVSTVGQSPKTVEIHCYSLGMS